MPAYKCPSCGQVYNQKDIYYCLRCNCRLQNVEKISHSDVPNKPNQDKHIIGVVNTQSQYIPKCPTCESPNIEKISTTKKVVGGALFGLFSSDVRKTMHCKNCGYKW